MRVATIVLVLLLLAGLCMPASAIDRHTTFVAGFDSSAQPDYCAGEWRSALIDWPLVLGEVELVEGRLGSAILLREGQSPTYDAQGKINAAAGTVEVWVLWTEELAAAETAGVFEFVTENDNYVRMNKISQTRLGMAFNGGPPDDLQWQRVDVDPSGWQADTWHHLAGTWEGGSIALYVDGQLVDESTQANGLTQTPDTFDVGGGARVLDEVRISSIARSPEELAARASAQEDEARWMYVTEMEPAAAGQALGSVGIDAHTAIDDRELPMVIGDRAYARGVAIRAPGFVEFEVPEGYARLTGVCGVSLLGAEGASADVTMSLDGAVAAEHSGLSGADSAEIALDVQGGQRLRIEADPAGAPGAVAVVGDLMLLAADVEGPGSFSSEMEADQITIQQMRTHVAEFEFDLPQAPKGYAIYAGHPVDRIAPTVEPAGTAFPEALAIQASPGEYEAAQFTLCAAQDLPSVTVSAGALSGDAGAIGSEQITVRLVRQTLLRRGHHQPRKPSNYEVVSRFLFPNREFWLPRGNLKQVYVLVHVPDDAAPGEYRGTLSVAAEGSEPTEMALNLTVHPIDLVQPRDKRYGMYYRMRFVVDRPEQRRVQFADMAAHGCTMIKGGVGIDFSRDEAGTITWDFDRLRTMLETGREHGFFGEITVYDNLPRLASLMGYGGLDEEGNGEPVSEQEDVLDVARRCFAELKQLEDEYDEYEFLLTHMDEVFGRSRLPRYLDFAEVIRKTSDFRIYITLHMLPGRWREYMERSDPWIDVRSINGHSLEAWLRDGHDWEELARMLAEAGDDGWMYHNMRGSFFRPEWNRFINGLFMWVSPLEVHVPWMYYAPNVSPYDDTDTEGFDYGYAFPHPGDPTRMIPTLHYEAFREGYDDMRYLKTLERTMQRARAEGVDVAAAQQWLGQVVAMLPQLPEDIQGIELESPYSVAASRTFSGADYDAIREQTARHIIRLQEQLGG